MPQINRIRVNNVKYNFGTQCYDDFMMRFNCSNTLYDLANGGGKSLLMLLLMQNVIPNCTLDDKQPIEKLFRPGCGNTVIHSLVEWKLDSCYQKDNYRYMTTGFCARRAKLGDESREDNDASSSVEYFNYCIFYREFGENDIKNLPLVSNGERITYNGLKAYLRDLEKKDFNVSVRIFEGKGEYQSFLTGYGIFESQWEIIRGINKTEGHVRAYFENSYKTSRKVVEDLLIEEIIQKSYNNRLGVDSDDKNMAETLMDIKDKLLELSKKHAQINSYDSQSVALSDFAEYVESFRAVYEKKSALERRLYELYLVYKKSMLTKEQELTRIQSHLELLSGQRRKELYNVACGEVAGEQVTLREVEALIAEAEASLREIDEKIEENRHKLTDLESAADYEEYMRLNSGVIRINEIINNSSRADDELIAELRAIASIIYQDNERLMAELQDRYDREDAEWNRLNSECGLIEEQLKEAGASELMARARAEYVESELAGIDDHYKNCMQEAGLLVSEDARGLKGELESLIRVLAQEKSDIDNRLDSLKLESVSLRSRQSALKLREELLTAELNRASGISELRADSSDRLARLCQVYRNNNQCSCEELAASIYDIYERVYADERELKAQVERLEAYMAETRSGAISMDDPVRNRLKSYLSGTYGDDVEEGCEWFGRLNPGQKRDLRKRVPFIEYGFIIKNDFERIKEDAALRDCMLGAYTVPVVSEQVLYETRLGVDTEHVVFARKDLSFLGDEARMAVELEVRGQELEELRRAYDKLADRRAVVWKDYMWAATETLVAKNSSTVDVEEIRAQLRGCEEEYIRLTTELEAGEVRERELAEASDKLLMRTQEAERRRVVLAEVLECDAKRAEYAKQLEADRGLAASAAREAAELKLRADECRRSASDVGDVRRALSDKLSGMRESWKRLYELYYEAGDSTGGYEELKSLDREQLESRFLALKELVDKAHSDMSDKESLRQHYLEAMDKCLAAIEYRGSDIDAIRRRVSEGELASVGADRLMELKAGIRGLLDGSQSRRSELEAQNAMKNRLEGSISHGIGQIIERFGHYDEEIIENPTEYVKQHKGLSIKLEEDYDRVKGDIDSINRELRDIYGCCKELERIIIGAGMTVPDDEELYKAELGVVNEDYIEVSKEYDRHIRQLSKKQEEFAKKKLSLAELINGYGGAGLAAEIRSYVNMPEDVGQVEELKRRLLETTDIIGLEKDRIHKSIQDMERIKENFENRCIQTCSNIKTDLDRLGKLSTIKLDGETIAIIGLTIPYVEPSEYKKNMSDYIDETIAMAESFPTPEDRLRYIRNRLSWKRLFSVIVKDMNLIKLNLYKRERIKDQSRYLRYEEAVGSTGQSQGIYIQFLIAIINYISSINATTGESSILSKTIFIDNPFGAAKDIYIWEPIFKLLKTNHVQLVVPARGATPAITGRFDVNYILGQKLVDNRQQTVVVDYYSKLSTEQMEYVRMEYEQTSFVFD